MTPSERAERTEIEREMQEALRVNNCTPELAFWLSKLHRRVMDLSREVERLRQRAAKP